MLHSLSGSLRLTHSIFSIWHCRAHDQRASPASARTATSATHNCQQIKSHSHQMLSGVLKLERYWRIRLQTRVKVACTHIRTKTWYKQQDIRQNTHKADPQMAYRWQNDVHIFKTNQRWNSPELPVRLASSFGCWIFLRLKSLISLLLWYTRTRWKGWSFIQQHAERISALLLSPLTTINGSRRVDLWWDTHARHLLFCSLLSCDSLL